MSHERRFPFDKREILCNFFQVSINCVFKGEHCLRLKFRLQPGRAMRWECYLGGARNVLVFLLLAGLGWTTSFGAGAPPAPDRLTLSGVSRDVQGRPFQSVKLRGGGGGREF
jgi:hypothetical protein